MLANWVMQQVTLGGTGDIAIGDAVNGFIKLADTFSNNAKVFYTLIDGTDRETGIGTMVLSGQGLTRDQVLETLVAGVYTNSSPTAIDLTTNATLMVTPTVQGITTHLAVWNELSLDLTIPTSTGSVVPDYKPFVGTIEGFHFSPDTEEYLGLRASLGNTVEAGSVVIPSVRWSPTDTGAGDVRWGVALTLAALDGTFTDLGIIYLVQASGGVVNVHQQVEFLTSTISIPEENTLMVGRVFRDSTHAEDTYTGEAVLHSVGVSYLANKVGTPKRNIDHNNWG